MTRSMTHSISRSVFIALVATLAGATTHQAQAQDAFVYLDVPARPAAAEEMEQRAQDLLTAGRGWEEAAGLYLRAAELRGAGDLQSADNLRLAGYVHFYRGRAKAAVVSLTQAGETFLALGDVERAAASFIDAAWVAAQADMAVQAHDLGDRGQLLTRSPLLGAENRTALVRRLGGVPGIE